jgi:predicted Zn finger-like uncharacterized protein
MNVSCPECSSVFRVDPAKIPSGAVRARCSVCGGIITINSMADARADFATAPAGVPIAPPIAAPPAPPAPPTPPTPAAPPEPPAPAAPTPVVALPAVQPPPPVPASAAPTPIIATPVVPSFSTPVRQPVPPAAPPRPVQPSVAMPAPFARPSSAGPAAPANADRPPMRPSFATPHQVISPQPARPTIPTPVIPAPATAAPPAASAPPAATVAPRPAAPAVGATPARAPINPFLANDPNAKAKRLARALVSDICAYFPQKREEGIRDGTLKQLFREEIKKSYEEYIDQIGREFADGTTHFQDALNDVLAGGKKLF